MKSTTRLRGFVMWSSAATLALLVTVWATSGFVVINRQSPEWSIYLESGAIIFQKEEFPVTKSLGWRFGEGSHGYYHAWHWWFGQVRLKKFPALVFPLWPQIVVFSVVTGLAWRPEIVAVRRARKGQCPRCAYDQSGIDAGVACPECGKRELNIR